jgi:hypothetical protein
MLFARASKRTANIAHSRDFLEGVLRDVTPVFVNSFNQYTYLSGIIDALHLNGFKQIFVLDQASEYPPLLDYFISQSFQSKARLISIGRNIGPREAVRFVRSLGFGTFVFTDPDIEVPKSMDPYFLSTLFETSRRYRCKKVGLALDISEPHRFKDIKCKDSSGRELGIVEWESRFWRHKIESKIFRAPVDTTFFLYFEGVGLDFRRSLGGRIRNVVSGRVFDSIANGWGADLRVGGAGFVARHLPWYLDDPVPLEEVEFYRKAATQWSNWISDTSRG